MRAHVLCACQVWFPDSAFKTATAMRDFNAHGERLPLIVFANWCACDATLAAVVMMSCDCVQAWIQWRHARHVRRHSQGADCDAV
jgi:hypothetical protein